MAISANKFNIAALNFTNGLVDLNSDSVYVLLTNTAPNAADTVVNTTGTVCVVASTSNANEIAAGNGYTKGGVQLASNSTSQTSGTMTMAANDGVITASGGSIGPFRYAVLYDVTVGTTSTRPVIAWWDYGSGLTLTSGQTVTFQNSNGSGNFTSTYPLVQSS